jgi:hypothetical protein
MTNPNATHATETLKYFRQTVALLAQNTIGNVQVETEINLRYAAFIQNNIVTIAEKMQSELAYYLNFYKVTPADDIYDEFKNFYFLGMAIAAELENLGAKDLEKLQLKAILQLLNVRLKSVGAYRHQLSRRLSNAIDNGAIKNDFGRFGWYILYKCLFNATTERV